MRFLSSVIPHVISESVFSVESFVTIVTLVETLPVYPHMSQQNKPSCELLFAKLALKGLFTSVVSYVIV